MRNFALIMVAVVAMAFVAPAALACGGMTILPPPPASDPDVPDLPADGDLADHCRAATESGVCGAPTTDDSDFCETCEDDASTDSVYTEAIL